MGYKFISIGLFVLISSSLEAQMWKKRDDVFNTSGIPSLSFSQPRFADLDKDGDQDLILGSINEKPMYFENTGTATAPKFMFKETVLAGVNPLDAELMCAADLDGDGMLDLISGGYTGVQLFKNSGTLSQPVYELVPDFFNLSVGNSPVPYLGDVDGDGDQDLIVGLSESGEIYLYTNTGSATEAQFSETSKSLIDDVGLYAYPLFCDFDQDGDLDLLSGRDGSGFYYYQNQGTVNSPNWVQNYSLFSGLAGNEYFNSPAIVDLDGNNKLDIIYGTAEGPLKYYKNYGSTTATSWSENKDLFGGVIDCGGASQPVFIDYDNDGDFDMFTGSTLGDIKFYRNTGTPQKATWKEENLGLSKLKHSIYSSITFGDINHDDLLDVIVGDLSGNLYLHLQSENGYLTMETALDSLNFGSFSSPRLIDFDNDNDLDIIVGNDEGNLIYLENQGTAEKPDWIEDTHLFAGLNFSDNAVVSLAHLSSNEGWDMVVGNLWGDLNFYTYRNQEWVNADSVLEGMETSQNATPALIDLDNDGDLDLVVGNYDGTFDYYENQKIILDIIQRQAKSFKKLDAAIYPNPFNTHLTIQINNQEIKTLNIRILSPLGQNLYFKQLLPTQGQSNVSFETNDLGYSGLLIYQLEDDDHKFPSQTGLIYRNIE